MSASLLLSRAAPPQHAEAGPETPETPETLAAAPEEGVERVGPYRILSVIGRGGAGVVFRAQHGESGEIVALKRLLAASPSDLRSMRREIDALRRLDHPGVVRILDQGVDRAVPWYAMELLEGETLASFATRLWTGDGRLLERGTTLTENALRARESAPPRGVSEDSAIIPSDPTRARAARGALPLVLEIVRGLCETLAFVHGEGVVHRDLKCANVLLGADGLPRLLDFGLAWRFPGGAGREVLDDVSAGAAGTAAYMSPEQIRGEMVDARADLYSVGCMLYELLTGRTPFAGRSAAEVRRCHLNLAVLPASSLVEGVPPVLDDLLLQLLQKRAADRPGHASEVAGVLGSLGGSRDLWGAQRAPQSYVYRAALVGRAEARQALEARAERALHARGSLLLISGESGIGKTYLAMAAGRDASLRGLRVVTSTCVSLGGAEAQPNEAVLHPFRNLLLAIADVCIATPELVPVLLGERARLLAACEPSLGSLPGVAGYPEPEPLPASAARQRLLRALEETLAAFARVSPFAFIIDDLQWADEISLDFLSSLPDGWFDGKRVVILGVYRTDEETAQIRALRQRPHVDRLSLGRLSERALDELARGMLALGSAPAGFVELFVRQAEGNPFFAAEYLRAAVGERLLYRSPTGSWQLDARLLRTDAGAAALALPTSIAALIGRRLDGLSGPAQQVLAAAAVLGREAEWSLLLEVAGLSEEQAWQPLRELVARQILEEAQSTAGAESRLRFLHDKLREAAHARIPNVQRRALHARAAAAIEQTLQGSPELLLVHAALAHHHSQAEQLREAVAHLELAGDHALATYANREAVRHFGSALELELRLLPDATATGKAAARGAALRRARWERKLAEACYALGDLDAVERHTLRALQHTGHPPPRSALGWRWSLVVELLEQVKHRLGPGWTPQPLDATEQETLVEAALATHHLAERSYYNFEALPMIVASLRSVNLGERAGVAVKIATPYALLGMTAGISRLSGLGHRYFELARSAARSTDDHAGLAYSLYSKAAWKIGHGSWQEVRELCAECAEIARRTRNVKALGMAQTLIGHADFYTGRFRESAEMYRELERTARANGDQQHLSWGLYAGARARICLGELSEARAMLLESNALLEPLVEVPSKIIAPGLLASLYLRTGELGPALTAAELTAERIRSNLPTVFATVAGYAGVCEVYLARWEQLLRAGDRRAPAARIARKAARRAVFDLWTLALGIPIGWPYYHRLQGELRRIDGDRAGAAQALRRALRAAAQLGMPYEEALAHLQLAQLAPPRSAEREEQARSAERLLERLSCRLDLELARRLRRDPRA